MSKNTTAGSTRPRKADRPKKPYAAFPLTPHAGGKWQKKINGKIHYFGQWARRVNGKLERIEGDGWREALEEYKLVADDLHAGRAPQTQGNDLTVGSLCNSFLNSKLRKRQSAELKRQTFEDYKIVTDLLVAHFGERRSVAGLTADDFGRLRALMAKRWGPTRLAYSIVRVRSVFKHAVENGLIDRAVRYGSEFKRPDPAVMRRHRADGGERMLEPGQLRALLNTASLQMRAMVLLGLNAGLGNTDCGRLPISAVNLKTKWLNYARHKTGIDRRCPLWSETVNAIRDAIEQRPEPVDDEAGRLVFLTDVGKPWVIGDEYRQDWIAQRFTALLKQTDLHRPRLGFYTLRHVFRTVADECRDPVAIDLIMGHRDPSMAAHYRERVDDSRLVAVTDHVHDWLYPVH